MTDSPIYPHQSTFEKKNNRLSTIRNADLIVCMALGKIVEQGSFDQLMKLDGGTFATLARQQGLA